MNNLDKYLKEVKQRVSGATEGPWKFHHHKWKYPIMNKHQHIIVSKTNGIDDDADFIAHSRQDIEMLLEMVEECTKQYTDMSCCCDVVKPKCLRCSSLERFETIAEKYK